MHERKARMADLAEMFLALAGGYRTLEDSCEVVNWTQLGVHAKPCGFLDVDGSMNAAGSVRVGGGPARQEKNSIRQTGLIC
jgi:predicted Rossmann-fold nucleotide-binding protein